MALQREATLDNIASKIRIKHEEHLKGRKRNPARVECAEPLLKLARQESAFTASAPYMTLLRPGH
jgi:hypothetical protein